jgi:NarL family two-component system response regulator LiaR
MAQNPIIRVMIADDHDMLRKGVAVLLEAFEDLQLIGEASNGLEAVDLCSQLEPDVILMDLMMPEMNGITAINLIRQKHPLVQVIALTSFTSEELVQSALQAGAISYLLKNVSMDELADTIRAAYSGKSVLSEEATQALVNITHNPPSSYYLTTREQEVLQLMVKGLSNIQIARHLTISQSTVKKHVSSILSKLQVNSRTEAVALAVHHKILA